MPLIGLAEEIVSLSRVGRRTPVLVTPRYLSVRNRFLVELLRGITASESLSSGQEPTAARIDWLCNTSLLRQRIARIRAKRIDTLLHRDASLRGRAEVVVSASIGRREYADNTLVVGLCDEDQDLPTWALKIQLSGLPRHQPLPAT